MLITHNLFSYLAPFRTKKEQDASKCLRRLENEIVGRLYYNRNKSHSYNNFGMPHSTKNKNFFSPIKGNYKEKCNDENLYRTMKNDDFGDNVTITQGNFVKKNSMGVKGNSKNELNDFNSFLEKLSKYEHKKGGIK